MFNINDIVLYGSYGACHIIDIAEREFCGKSGLYYVLTPVFDDRCTYFVSAENELAVSRLRQVMPLAKVQALIASMPEVDEQWEDNPKLRKARYSEIIASGDRQELIGLIKALHSHQQRQQANGKKLNMSDEQSLKTAEKMIYDEIALAAQILPEEVADYISRQLSTVV